MIQILFFICNFPIFLCKYGQIQVHIPFLSFLFCVGVQPIVGFPGGSEGKESAGNAEDLVLVPVVGRSPG